MKPNEYGPSSDPMTLITELRRDVDRLTAELKQRAGVPITQASSAFLIPATSTPAAPSGAAYLFFDGSTLRVRTPSTNYSTLPPEVPVASAVANAGNVLSGDAPGTWNATWGQHIYNATVDNKNTINALLSSLRAAPLMDS